MKNKIKYILAAIVSIVGIGLLIFALYLQIQDHASTRSIIWSIIEILILLSAAFYYFRSAIKNTSDDKHNEEDSLILAKLVCTWYVGAVVGFGVGGLKGSYYERRSTYG